MTLYGHLWSCGICTMFRCKHIIFFYQIACRSLQLCRKTKKKSFSLARCIFLKKNSDGLEINLVWPNFFATKISVVISHRRLTYGELVSLLSTFFLTIQTIESSMYEFSSSFIWRSKKTKNINMTVEEAWYTNFLYTDLTISLNFKLKGHNSGTPCRTSQNKCHAHLLFIKFMYINFPFRDPDNCGISIRLKKAT